MQGMQEMGSGLPAWLTTVSWLWIAVAAVSATVVAFDVGMLGWMLLLHHNEAMPGVTDVRFTFLMQVGLVLGTLTAAPVVRRLSRGSSPGALRAV